MRRFVLSMLTIDGCRTARTLPPVHLARTGCNKVAMRSCFVSMLFRGELFGSGYDDVFELLSVLEAVPPGPTAPAPLLQLLGV